MQELHRRKQIRLEGYDYSESGYYFVTICVKDKHEILSRIDTDADVGANCVRPAKTDGVRPAKTADVRPAKTDDVRPAKTDGVRPAKTDGVCPQLSEIGFVIENEISNLSNIYENVSIDNYVIMPNHVHMIVVLDNHCGRTQFAPTVSRIVKQFKGVITKRIGFSIWQRSFYDRVIRNQEEYQKSIGILIPIRKNGKPTLIMQKRPNKKSLETNSVTG